MSATESLNKVDRLRVAAVVAPKVRRGDGAARRVKVVDRDGNIVREVTLDDIRAGIAERLGVEFAVAPDKRPDRIVCKQCRRVVDVPVRVGVPPQYCRGGCLCDCGGTMSFSTVIQARRSGRKPVCQACSRERQKGDTLERQKTAAAARRRPTTVGGVTYESLTAAANALGLKVGTLRHRLKRGLMT